MSRMRIALVLAVLPLSLSPAAVGAEPSDPNDPRRRAREAQPLENRDRGKALIERPDRKRADTQLSVPLFDRPLTLSGRYTFQTIYEAKRPLRFDFFDAADESARGRIPKEDRARVDQSLELDVYYPVTEDIAAYIEGRLGWDNLVKSRVDSEGDEWTLARDESWLYLGNLFDTPVSLQVGRQRFSDEREWLWDDNLDALRVHFDRESFHAEVALAHEMFPAATNEDFIDPEQKDVLRILASAGWDWASKQEVGVYILHQQDRSSRHRVGVCNLFAPDPIDTSGCVDPEREDETDADLTWLGGSANGRGKLGAAGAFEYWGNLAIVTGEETLFDLSGSGNPSPTDPEGRHLEADGINRYDVFGWGLDLGATWQTPLPASPSLTFGYAYGSGSGHPTRNRNRGFRQTGLQDNNDKFRGVDSFRYYGELLEPELSNLHVITAALGFPILSSSSIEIVYHHYRQDKAAPFLRDVSFNRRPDGKHKSLGDEWDLILGIEEWAPFELELIGSVFRNGRAFAPKEGRLSYLGIFQARLNF